VKENDHSDDGMRRAAAWTDNGKLCAEGG
jgi:hypothetical protein